jgi:hypothetical protein
MNRDLSRAPLVHPDCAGKLMPMWSVYLGTGLTFVVLVLLGLQVLTAVLWPTGPGMAMR